MDEIGFGRGIRALRIGARLTQDELSRKAGVSRSVIARIEQGRGDRVTVRTLDRVAGALRARVACRLSWNGEALDRLLDADHAAAVEEVVRTLTAAGWLVATEASFNVFGERGSVDVLAYHPATRVALVVEVKSVVPDVQAMLMSLDRKHRLAREISTERGWRPLSAGRLLVIRDQRTARRRVDQHAATFANAFPDRIARIRSWLRQPDPSRPLSGLWFLPAGPHTVTRHRVATPAAAAKRGRNQES